MYVAHAQYAALLVALYIPLCVLCLVYYVVFVNYSCLLNVYCYMSNVQSDVSSCKILTAGPLHGQQGVQTSIINHYVNLG